MLVNALPLLEAQASSEIENIVTTTDKLLEFADTPDTLFFRTDGEPTDGEITKADELLGWFNERNRFSRLRVHVISLGNTGVDHEFLRKLAESNGGQYVNLSGTY